MRLLLALLVLAILHNHAQGATSVVGPFTLTFSSSQGSFSQANSTCVARHSWVVETKNEEINTAVAQLIGSQKAWIGLRYYTDSSTWKWNDWGEMEYSNWNSDEPDMLSTEHCAVVVGGGGNWYNVACHSFRYIACQSVTKPMITSGVYLLTRSDNSLSSEQAEQACTNGNGWLVRIKDAELNTAVFDLIRTYSGSYWMGLKHNTGSAIVSWTDGDALQDGEYNKLSTQRPRSPGKDCVVISPYDSFWSWKQCSSALGYVCQSTPCAGSPCENGEACKVTTTRPYFECHDPCDPDPCSCDQVCEVNGMTHSCTNHCISNPCQNGGTCAGSKTAAPYYICSCIPAYKGNECQDPIFFTSDSCKYHLNKYQQSFTHAKDTCESVGGVMAMIKDGETHNFIMASFKSLYTSRTEDYALWIGGVKDGSWKWLDNTTIPMHTDEGFSAWADGLGNGPARPAGYGNCLLLTTWTNKKSNKWTGFDWGDISCSATAGVACEMPTADPCLNCAHGNCTSIGCQWKCSCHAGYNGLLCTKDLLRIEAEHSQMTVTEGRSVSILLNITSFDTAATYVKGYKNSAGFDNPFQTMPVTANGTFIFRLGSVDESSGGSYTFIAGTENYHRKATVEILVFDLELTTPLQTSLIASSRDSTTKRFTVTNNALPIIEIGTAVLALGIVLVFVNIFIMRRGQNKIATLGQRITEAELDVVAASRNAAYENEMEMCPGNSEQPGHDIYTNQPETHYESIKETAIKKASPHEL